MLRFLAYATGGGEHWIEKGNGMWQIDTKGIPDRAEKAYGFRPRSDGGDLKL